jgi:ribosomal protein L34E
MPHHRTDFGGSNYRRPRKRTFDPHRDVTLRCLDCDRLQYVLLAELHRAARPRCIACGGPLDETEATRERRADDQLSVQLSDAEPCLGCGRLFHGIDALRLHLLVSDACACAHQF